MKMTCDGCDQRLLVDSENTQVFMYLEEPAYSHARIKCACGQVYHLLADEDDLKDLLDPEIGLAQFTEDKPPLHIRAAFDQLVNKKDKVAQPPSLETHELTPREENYVSTLAWELDTATVQDILDVPIDTRLPQRNR